MRRRLISLLCIVVVAASCSGGSEETEATYFADAATITATYENAALGHFDVYLTSLEEATAETGDVIFVDANKRLFAGLAEEFGPAVDALDNLVPPEEVAGPHAEWLSAGRALNDVFQSTDDVLSSLDLADDVNAVVSELPLRDLQAAYRTACQAVAALASQGDDPTAVIVCQPPENGA